MNILTVGFITVFVLSFVLRLFSHRIRGVLGETKVSRILRTLPTEKYTIISDLLIPTSFGTSQIDHIVVSRSGLFVIETKNFSGWIHGNENSEYWTKTKYRYRTEFRNPIKQNWAHVYALKEVLSDLKSIVYHPIVVFIGNAELKNVHSRTPVIYENELLRMILDTSGGTNLTIDQIDNIVRRLKEVCLRDKDSKRAHIRVTREHTLRRRQMEQAGICPKCGGSLVERSGRYGIFYGCSGYPGCTYTQRYRTR